MATAADYLKKFDQEKLRLKKATEQLEEARVRYQVMEQEWTQAKQDLEHARVQLDAELKRDQAEAIETSKPSMT